MSSETTAWHVPFAALVRERAPADFSVQVEVPLSLQPQRADLLLVRRTPPAHGPAAQVLRGLWPRLGTDALVEFKSQARPLRRGGVAKLLGYGAQYHGQNGERLRPAQLTLVLAVARRTPTLTEELEHMGWDEGPAVGGYVPVTSAPYPLVVALLDEVAKAEGDELLAWLSRRNVPLSDAARAWVRAHLLAAGREVPMQELEGYEDMMRSLLETLPPATIAQVLAGLAPEQRLAGLAPEQRLAGLAPEQRLAGLAPEQRLAGLLAGLTPEQEAQLKAELRRRGW
jgi:hypothetical protein